MNVEKLGQDLDAPRVRVTKLGPKLDVLYMRVIDLPLDANASSSKLSTIIEVPNRT